MKKSEFSKKSNDISEETGRAIVKLGKLVLKFGRTNRVTYHEDGTTQESDTDHTVMLSLIACAVADSFVPRLEIGKIAQFCLIHDLVEVYAGDTPTLKISDADRKLKDARERKALDQIESEFNTYFPWIVKTIEEYESLKTPEARFVKAVDKLMPNITHILNAAKVIKENDIDLDELKEKHSEHRRDMSITYAHDQPEVIELHKILSQLVYSEF